MVPEVPKALADMQLEAGIAREEDLGVVHRTVPEVQEARHIDQEEDREAVRRSVLDAVRRVAGSPAEVLVQQVAAGCWPATIVVVAGRVVRSMVVDPGLREAAEGRREGP